MNLYQSYFKYRQCYWGLFCITTETWCYFSYKYELTALSIICLPWKQWQIFGKHAKYFTCKRPPFPLSASIDYDYWYILYLLHVFYMALWPPPRKRMHQSNSLIIFSSVKKQLMQIAPNFLTNIKMHEAGFPTNYVSLLSALTLLFILGEMFSPLKQR